MTDTCRSSYKSIEELVQEKTGHLPPSKQRIYREFLERMDREFGRDYKYGFDEELITKDHD